MERNYPLWNETDFHVLRGGDKYGYLFVDEFIFGRDEKKDWKAIGLIKNIHDYYLSR